MDQLSHPTFGAFTERSAAETDQSLKRLRPWPFGLCLAIALVAIAAAQISCGRAPRDSGQPCAQSAMPADTVKPGGDPLWRRRPIDVYDLSTKNLQRKYPKPFHHDLNAVRYLSCMSTQPVPAARFLGSLGVNVHVEYTDGRYANSSNVISDLAFLGIDQVRDANLNPANQGQSSYAALAVAGIKFDLIVGGGRPISQSMASLDAFVQAHPGAVEAVEGPNEVNNWPITYNGLSGDPAYIAFQSALDGAVKGDSLLSGAFVYGLTGSYAIVSGFDFANIHPYANNGAQPYAAMASGLADYATRTGNVPFVITEDGYNTLAKPGDVDQLTQAKETLNMLFDAQKLGASKVFLYQLLDAYAPGTPAGRDQFGLFNYDNSAKPVATAIHDLTTILADTGAGAASFQTRALNYSISNLPSAGSSLLLEKSDGAFDIVLWSEPQVWDATTSSEVAVAPTQTTIGLGATYSEVKVFDPLLGATPISDVHDVSQITVGLTDHPLIIEVEPILVWFSLGRPPATVTVSPFAAAPPLEPAAATAAIRGEPAASHAGTALESVHHDAHALAGAVDLMASSFEANPGMMLLGDHLAYLSGHSLAASDWLV
jgi:hypothetical protein